MISKDEIMAVADGTDLTPNIVEKDYVLGWLLAAINNNPVLSQSWIFKGGTCLRKCYFETYRFSEDLDFTVKEHNHISEKFLIEQFSSLAGWLYENTGIEAPVDRLTFDVYTNPQGNQFCQGRVYYKSHFAAGKRNLPRIKLDLTADEVLVNPSSRRDVFHPYSDFPQSGIFIESYDYPELVGEKLRALGERCRPRDLYDVINLFRNEHLPDSTVVRDILSKKSAYKNIDILALADMGAYKDDMERNWEPMLAHQLPVLPDFKVFWRSLPNLFEWLEGRGTLERVQLDAISSEGQVYQPLYGHLGLKTPGGKSLEVIRFAAGNRLCVNLDCVVSCGRRGSSVIEPYSLRQTQNSKVHLYGVQTSDGQIRGYEIDQIIDVSVTNRLFTPRFKVELSPTRISIAIPRSEV